MFFFSLRKYSVAGIKAEVSEARGKETVTVRKVTIGSKYKKGQFSWFKQRKESTRAHQ